jgi:archaemetzincin
VRSRTLGLLPLGPPFPDPDLVEWLGRALRRRLRIRVLREEGRALPSATNPGRASADAVLDLLAGIRPPLHDRAPARWTLALTAADLHAPGRSFVFGAAAVGGAWAVVSTARLLPDDPRLHRELLRERILKEVLHELGHVAALPHCAAPRCVMVFSADVEGVDRKGTDFCVACSGRLATLDPPLDAR